MIGDISIAANVFIVTGYTDMRKSIDGLCSIIYQQLKAEPDKTSIYLFCGKRCDRIKILLRDGHQGYNKLTESKRCCCYAHIRRYFLEAIPKGQEKDYTHPAVQGVLYCDKLFAYERSYREKSLSYDQIKKRRLKDQKPVIEGFLAWCKQGSAGTSQKLKKAFTYVKNREEYLMTYLEDGRCSLSNNLSENAIRPVTVGRKNWLFSDSPEGATANALCLTIVEMAKAYQLNLYEYLKFLLSKRPSKEMSSEELEKLAPWNEEVQGMCKIN